MENNIKLPYLSIVTWSRNDDHGKDMFKRMQIVLTSFITQLERYKLESEIVLVDYNPPKDNPLLKDALLWPTQTKYCSLRTVIVPSSIHKRYRDSDRLPVNGPVAFNVGLRRSRGQFVLLVPIDNLFSNELVELLAKKNLKNDKFYRADRLDVSRKVIEIDSLEERDRFCRKNILWIYTRYGSIPVVREKKHYRSVNLDFTNIGNRFPVLHTNGPDLMLTSRESWFLLRGYPEIDTFGFHVDSLLCYLAYFNGLKEEILPSECCPFHIDHDSRWRDIRPSCLEKILFYCLPDILALRLGWLINRVLHKLFPETMKRKSMIMLNRLGVNLFDSRPILSEMRRSGHANVFNTIDWGLGKELLEEYVIRQAEWDRAAG